MRRLASILGLLCIALFGVLAVSAGGDVHTCTEEIERLCPVEITKHEPIFNTPCYYANRFKLSPGCQQTIEQFRQLVLHHRVPFPKNEGGYSEAEKVHYSCHADIQRLCPHIQPPYNPHKLFQNSCFRRHVTEMSPRCIHAMNTHVRHHKGSIIVMETLPYLVIFGCACAILLGVFLFVVAFTMRRSKEISDNKNYTKLEILPRTIDEIDSSDSDSDSEYETAEIVQSNSSVIPMLYDYTGNYQVIPTMPAPGMYMPQLVQPMNQHPYYYYPMQMPLVEERHNEQQQQ